MQVGEFHAGEGWTFRRTDTGQVEIRKYADRGMTMMEIGATFGPGVWESIIAHVSAKGETTEQYIAAEKFHSTI